MDYSVIRKAGLSRAEVASILGVSYVTIWKYMKTTTEPREMYQGVPLRRRTMILLAILNKLVEAKKLPLVNAPFSKRMSPEIKDRRESLCDKLRDLVNTKIAEQPANT